MMPLLEGRMRRTEQRQGLRMLKLRDVLGRVEAGGLSQLEAAELLGMSERSFRRWSRRFEADGEEGLLDRRLGRRSGRAVPDDEAERLERLYRERYAGFTAKHFHEHLVRDHGFRWGYTWTKTYLQGRGLLAKAPRRGAHRRKRPRRPMVGMMLHQDASRHAWLEGHGPLDLVVTLDDATSEIYSAFLVEEEGTVSSFLGLIETIAAKGLFCSLYTDRGSLYFHTPEEGGKVAPGAVTQVGRALGQLGIEHIAAYSPEAPLRQAQEPIGARFPHPAGPPAQGAGSGRRHGRRGGQRLHPRGLSAGPQRPLRHKGGRRAKRLRAGRGGAMARHPVPPRGARRRAGQHGRLERQALADSASSRAGALRARQGPGPPLPERRTCYLPRTTTIGPMAPQSGGQHHSLIAGRMSPLCGRRRLWTAWTRLTPCPPRPQEQTQKSGHLMCYINRTTSEARYTAKRW